MGAYEGLCAMKHQLGSYRILPLAELVKPSKVGRNGEG